MPEIAILALHHDLACRRSEQAEAKYRGSVRQYGQGQCDREAVNTALATYEAAREASITTSRKLLAVALG